MAAINLKADELARHLADTAGVVVKVETKEKEKPKPKPSGVKPRQFLLLTLAICILSVPIIAIVTPVFVTARKQRDRDDSGSKQLCVVPVAYDYFSAPDNYTSTYIANLNKACDKFWSYISDPNVADEDTPGYADVLMTMSNIDPLNLLATVNVEVGFGGNITDSRGRLNITKISKDTTLNMDMVNTAGADVAYKQGDRPTQKSPKYTLQTVKSLFNYPFDKYKFDVILQGRLENSANASNQFNVLPISLKFQTGYVGWKISVQQSGNVYDQVIAPNPEGFLAWWYKVNSASNNDTSSSGDASSGADATSPSSSFAWTNFTSATDPKSPDALLVTDISYPNGINTDTVLKFTVTLERSSFVQFFSIMILTGMWLITSFLIGFGIDACYLRPRAVTMGDAGLFTGLLFALPGIRNAMPFVPPIGVAVDMFGFIWLMMFLMMTAVQVSSRAVMLYVHPEPTLYDEVLKTEAFHAYMKQKAEEEEEKKKKEEEKASAAKLA